MYEGQSVEELLAIRPAELNYNELEDLIWALNKWEDRIHEFKVAVNAQMTGKEVEATAASKVAGMSEDEREAYRKALSQSLQPPGVESAEIFGEM